MRHAQSWNRLYGPGWPVTFRGAKVRTLSWAYVVARREEVLLWVEDHIARVSLGEVMPELGSQPAPEVFWAQVRRLLAAVEDEALCESLVSRALCLDPVDVRRMAEALAINEEDVP